MKITDKHGNEFNTNEIGDLWHVAMHHADKGDQKTCDLILSVWHLAHAMRDHINASPKMDRDFIVNLANISFADVAAVYGKAADLNDEYLIEKHNKARKNPINWACELDTNNLHRFFNHFQGVK